MTLNELVKLTMLWTTGPWFLFGYCFKQDDDEILKISRNHFEEALKNIHRSLSDDEVVYYEKVAQEKDNFLFG